MQAKGVRVSGLVMNPADTLALTKLKTQPGGDYVLGSPAAQPGNVLWGVPWAVSIKQHSPKWHENWRLIDSGCSRLLQAHLEEGQSLQSFRLIYAMESEHRFVLDSLRVLMPAIVLS